MPGMDGVGSIEALRKDSIHGQTPIVVANSEGETSELLQAVRRLRVVAIVKKPWKPQQLARVVQQAVASGTAREIEKRVPVKPSLSRSAHRWSEP